VHYPANTTIYEKMRGLEMDNAAQWNEETLNEYIYDQVEESSALEYKSAAALNDVNGDKIKRDITKDVSAFANAAGGTLIYGIKEYDDELKKHLPESLDPVNSVSMTKERLEHLISLIQPRIHGMKITPIRLNSSSLPNGVAYVVEIPQGATAHQAWDKRYYRRFNFESVAMEDHEIRDVMNRSMTPDADVEFTHKLQGTNSESQSYGLIINVINQGNIVIDGFKLVFTFPEYGGCSFNDLTNNFRHAYFGLMKREIRDNKSIITCYSKDKLFPQDRMDLTDVIAGHYPVSQSLYQGEQMQKIMPEDRCLRWILYADDMIPKRGEISLSELWDGADHNWLKS
jgi:hypothetical protein